MGYILLTIAFVCFFVCVHVMTQAAALEKQWKETNRDYILTPKGKEWGDFSLPPHELAELYSLEKLQKMEKTVSDLGPYYSSHMSSLFRKALVIKKLSEMADEDI